MSHTSRNAVPVKRRTTAPSISSTAKRNESLPGAGCNGSRITFCCGCSRKAKGGSLKSENEASPPMDASCGVMVLTTMSRRSPSRNTAPPRCNAMDGGSRQLSAVAPSAARNASPSRTLLTIMGRPASAGAAHSGRAARSRHTAAGISPTGSATSPRSTVGPATTAASRNRMRHPASPVAASTATTPHNTNAMHAATSNPLRLMPGLPLEVHGRLQHLV